MNKKGFAGVIYSLFFFAVLSFSVAAQDYLALQGSAEGTGTSTGNIVVEIWSAATGGSLLYNSSNDFFGQLSNSRYDILLGNGSQPLSLNFSMTYYMNMYITGNDINFNGSDRQVFQSPVGNITVNDPIKTTSTSASALNINDFFNISGSNGNTISGGTLQLTNTDADDALNVTAGGVFIAGNTVFNRFFNITTTTSAVRTNGTITILNTADPALNVNNVFNVTGSNGNVRASGTLTIENGIDASGQTIIRGADTDDALNVTAGGVFIAGNTVFNRFFNITTTTSAVRTNGTITILSTADPALNINNVFNISGSNGNTVTSGSLRLDSTSGIVLDVAGPVVLRSTDVDDALNVTSGVTIAGKTLFTNTDTDDAVNFTLGGLAVRGGTLSAYYGGPGPSIGITSTNGVAFSVNQGFNISGANGEVLTNGTITVTSGNGMRVLNNVAMAFGGALTGPPTTLFIIDSNNILNITGSIVVFDRFFNITPATSTVRTNGTITILHPDVDDALNVSVGSIFTGGNITIGRPTNDDQHHLDIVSPTGAGAANRCSYIALANETGQLNYIFISNTSLRIATAVPTNCDNTEGILVGSQT